MEKSVVVLVDTSIWIATFRKKAPLDLPRYIPADDIVTCLPVIQEILQGFRDDHAYAIARNALLAMPILESPLSADVFEDAAQLYRMLRKVGRTVRSSVDCLIATCAIRNGVAILHDDDDFDAIASITSLEAQRIPAHH